MSAAEQRIVQIFRERADDAGAARDVLRHSEPLMPDPVRRGIARAWKRSKGKHADPGAFWGAEGPRVLHERFTGRGSWRAQGRQWLRGMVDHVASTVGTRADAPLMAALDGVLDPNSSKASTP